MLADDPKLGDARGLRKLVEPSGQAPIAGAGDIGQTLQSSLRAAGDVVSSGGDLGRQLDLKDPCFYMNTYPANIPALVCRRSCMHTHTLVVGLLISAHSEAKSQIVCLDGVFTDALSSFCCRHRSYHSSVLHPRGRFGRCRILESDRRRLEEDARAARKIVGRGAYYFDVRDGMNLLVDLRGVLATSRAAKRGRSRSRSPLCQNSIVAHRLPPNYCIPTEQVALTQRTTAFSLSTYLLYPRNYDATNRISIHCLFLTPGPFSLH